MKYLALLPSNQDRNVYSSGGHTEYEVLHQIALRAEQDAAGTPGLTVRAIQASPESSDSWRLQGLYQQVADAVNWLRQCGADPADAAMVNLHSDSGAKRHVFGIYGGGEGSASYGLARAVATEVEGVMGTGSLSYLDYSDYVFYQKRGPYNCCLIELGSHQNSTDIDYLLNHQPELARAVVQGAESYLGLSVAVPPTVVSNLAAAMGYFSSRGVPANPDAAIFKYWRAAFDLGDVANLGPAMSAEEPGDPYGEPDAAVQKFTNGIVVSKRQEGWKCYRAQVVLEPKRWLGDI